jgi:hypothetical protein
VKGEARDNDDQIITQVGVAHDRSTLGKRPSGGAARLDPTQRHCGPIMRIDNGQRGG